MDRRIAIVGAALLSGCASHESPIDPLEEVVDGDVLGDEHTLTIPEGERLRELPPPPVPELPMTRTSPEPTPPRTTVPRLRIATSGVEWVDECGIGLVSEGFPAATASGDILVVHEQGASPREGWFSVDVVWIDPPDETPREQMHVLDDSEDPPLPCARYRRLARERVATINARLLDEGARTLPRLPVRVFDPHAVDDSEVAVTGSMAPVEALYVGHSFVLRLRGIRVLERHERPSWIGRNPQCPSAPSFVALYGTAELGFAFIEFDHFCVGDEVFGVVPVASDTFKEMERRPAPP